MDTWYATNRLMQFVHDLKKTFYCAIQSNRLVSRTDKNYTYISLKDLHWSEEEKIKCQYRKQRIQCHHIACDFLVWIRLKSIAHTTRKTFYQLKQNLLRGLYDFPTTSSYFHGFRVSPRLRIHK